MDYADALPLQLGMRLGPYEITGAIGAGGMGEVYRARDTRLNRQVAIKVLRANLAASSERLRRFAREARAAGSLNHPNVLAIYDIGTHDGAPYIVSELLIGETLEQRLRGGPLPIRAAISYAVQIAAGLAAAHENGIVHRDLKPANVFLTSGGGLKILDFGLAKLLPSPADRPRPNASTATISFDTPFERVVGTPSYMSPEQVRAEGIDHRSDIFSFGVVFYEMLTGQRAFHGSSHLETMNMVLRQDPPPLDNRIATEMSPAVALILRRCLEKQREARFESARDLGFSLSAIGDSVSLAVRTRRLPVGSRRDFFLAGGVLSAAAAGFLIGRRTAPSHAPRFQRLTFRRGNLYSARFAADGQTIVYSAAWEGGPVQIYSVRPESPESAPIGFPGAKLLALSPTGELAIALGYHYVSGFVYSGMLARVPLEGGAPREIAGDVEWADWAPDGSGLAVVRHVAGKSRLEFPLDTVLYETSGWIGDIRFSRDGRRIGFLEYPTDGNDGGSAAFVTVSGTKTALSGVFEAAEGLSWSPDGAAVWFTAARVGANLNLYAGNRPGREREVACIPGWNRIADTSAAGRTLIGHGTLRFELFAFGPGQDKVRNLSWYDWSLARDISLDGTVVLFDESGEGGGKRIGVYVRKTDGSPAVRLGDGYAMSLSPDGRWALTFPAIGGSEIVLLPTGPGEPKHLPLPGGFSTAGAQWFPDGKRLLLAASERGHGVRLYEMELGTDLSATLPRPFSPEGVTRTWQAISPDGRFVVATHIDGHTNVYTTADGAVRPAAGVAIGERPIRWCDDPRYFYTQSRTEFPSRIYRIEFATGHRQLWKEMIPADPTGIRSITAVRISPNGKWYSYSLESVLDDLYLAGGLG